MSWTLGIPDKLGVLFPEGFSSYRKSTHRSVPCAWAVDQAKSYWSRRRLAHSPLQELWLSSAPPHRVVASGQFVLKNSNKFWTMVSPGTRGWAVAFLVCSVGRVHWQARVCNKGVGPVPSPAAVHLGSAGDGLAFPFKMSGRLCVLWRVGGAGRSPRVR